MIDALAEKVAIVTGGATGIGRAVAARLARAGVSVVIAGRNEERGAEAATALSKGGNAVRFIRTDVRGETAVMSLMQQVARLYGGVDYLVNNAGIEGILGPIDRNAEDVVDDVLATNIKGVFLCMKHAAPRMEERGGGVVVNVASFVGTTVPFPDAVVYGASKAAVLSMTRAAAAGLAAQNIRVYAVCPWITDTPMVDRLTGHQANAKAQFGAMNPSGRIVRPDDVAKVIGSLLGNETGQESGDAVLIDHAGETQQVQPMSACAHAEAHLEK